MNAVPENDFADVPSDTFYERSDDGAPAAAAALLSEQRNRPLLLAFVVLRSDAYFVAAENMSYSYDHYGYANGDVRLYHGSTCLLCPGAYRGPSFAGEDVTPAFSTYLVNNSEQPPGLGRNNQNFFYVEHGTFAALGMRFESSWAANRFDEGIVSPEAPLDYMIREAVHLRPGTLIVRDLHRRRHSTDTLAARWHLGSSETPQTTANGNRIGTIMQLQFANSTAPMELVTVFSETLTASTYAGGTLTLSDCTRVVFANNGADVQSAARPTKRRTVRR